MAEARQRDSAFDFVKGVLVLLMIVYHVMSIMSTASPAQFRYIRFISGAFIFVSGFIIGCYFWPAFQRQPGMASLRLVVRGVKLLAIFTALNILIYATGVGNIDKMKLASGSYWLHASSIYLIGKDKTSSFFILLPIGYLLIVAPFLLYMISFSRKPIALLLLAVALVAAAIPAVTEQSAVLEILLTGTAGLTTGLLINFENAAFSDAGIGPLLSLAGLTLAVWLTGRYGDNTAIYTIGIVFVIGLLYDLAKTVSANTQLGRWTILLGRYSLISYIAQIALIQAVYRFVVMRRLPLGFPIAVYCVMVAAVLVAMCLLLELTRLHSTAVDRSYRAIFS